MEEEPISSPKADGRTLRHEHRRRELLDLVTDRALNEGLQSWSLRSVARSLGVSHGTLLHHFDTRENLTLEVVRHLRRRLGQARDVERPPGEGLAQWWEVATTPETLKMFGLILDLATSAALNPNSQGNLVDELVTEPEAAVAQFLLQEGTSTEEVEQWATLLVAATRGLQMRLLLTGEPRPVDDAFDALSRMLLIRRAH